LPAAPEEGVVPTVFQDLAVCLAVGAILALSAHSQIRSAPSVLRGPWFRETTIFAFLIFLPTGVFFYLQWPDWSWLYYVDSRQVSGLLTGLTWLSYPLSVLVGFLLSALLLRGRRPRLALVVPAFGVVALIGVTAAAFHRFVHLTTYDQYMLYLQRPRTELPLAWEDRLWIVTMLGSGIFVGVPLLYLLVRNRRASKAPLLP
jgi:hypothetical protein